MEIYSTHSILRQTKQEISETTTRSTSSRDVPPIRKRASYVYHHISNESRKELVRRVICGNEKISQVAKDLQINYSSAKTVIATYRSQGRVEKIPHRRRINVLERITLKKDTLEVQSMKSSLNEVCEYQEKNEIIEANVSEESNWRHMEHGMVDFEQNYHVIREQNCDPMLNYMKSLVYQQFQVIHDFQTPSSRMEYQYY